MRALAILSTALLLTFGNQAALAAPLETLDIQTKSGPHHFRVEVMRSPEDLERGLMFRKTMPADQGMLFDFHRQQQVLFWMKNTIMSLDMIFIASDGTVVNVAENTVPMSERVIPSVAAVLGVLEVNAGTAKAIGLAKGDRVKNPMFGAP